MTIAALGLIRQEIPGRTLVAGLGVAIGAAVLDGLDVVAYTPYGGCHRTVRIPLSRIDRSR